MTNVDLDIPKLYTVAGLGARTVPGSHREDVVQDVVIRLVFRTRVEEKPVSDALVYFMARNEARSWWRRRQMQDKVHTTVDYRAFNVRDEGDLGLYYKDEREWQALQARVRHAVEALPVKVRVVADKVMAGEALTSTDRARLKRYRDAFIKGYAEVKG